MRRIAIILALLSPVLAHAAACPAGYAFWYPLTIAAQFSLAGNLSNFPMLFTGASNLATLANGGKAQLSTGIDITFCDGNNTGNLLAYELVTVSGTAIYSATTGAGEWYVLAPTISNSATETIYVGVGNASATDQSNKAAVWAAFSEVLHFGTASTLSVADSTGVNTPVNHSGAAVAGEVNGGLALVGASSQYVDGGATLNNAALTVEAWVNPTSLPGSCATEQTVGSNSNRANGFTFALCGIGVLDVNTWNAGSVSVYRTSGTPLVSGRWQYVVGSFAGGSATSTANYKTYLNAVPYAGSMVASAAATMANSATHFLVGNQAANNYYNGNIDEERVYPGVLTADWIAATNASISNPGCFYSIAGATNICPNPAFVPQPIVQSASHTGGGSSCTYPANVASGDPLIAVASVAGGTVSAVSDTQGSSWSLVDSNSTTVFTGAWIATAASSGADAITYTYTGSPTAVNVHCAEFNRSLATATVDSHANGAWSGSPAYETTSLLNTTYNGDILYYFFGGNASSGAIGAISPSVQLTSVNNGFDGASSYQVLGAPGAYAGWAQIFGTSAGNYVALTLQPAAAISIITSSLPTAKVNTPYLADLYAIQGTAPLAWSITSGSLFPGLTLNASAGSISGTPTAGGTDTFTVQVTDGTHSTTQALTIQVYASAATPSFIQAEQSASGNTTSFTSVSVGDILVVSGDSILNSGNGLTVPTDTLGTVFSLVGATTTVGYASIRTAYLWSGTATGSGADTVSTHGNDAISAMQVRGVQSFFDVASMSQGNASGTPVTVTLNPLIAPATNAMLYGFLLYVVGTPTTIALPPFTDAANTSGGAHVMDLSYYVAPSTADYAAAYSETGLVGAWYYLGHMLALRPSTSGVVSSGYSHAEVF